MNFCKLFVIPIIIHFVGNQECTKAAAYEATQSTSDTLDENKSLPTKTVNASSQTDDVHASKTTKSRREVRQIRMFNAILILMTTFLICRLPTWSYLVYKSNYPTKTNLEWMLNFCFGLLSMANCVMNPLLYTFLTETIEVSLSVINRSCKQLRLCCSFD